MAQAALNADLYAAPRQNKFFTANNQTPADGNLTGQCVTLTKWFMQDMSSVPLPFSARGDARYVGKTLVKQGHATEVPFAQRKRGDLICYEYGEYGHIAVQLSGGRVFEQNVNMGGVASKIVDGQRVYASRIGSENEAWRANKNPHIYRLKTYKEGSVMDVSWKREARRVAYLLYLERGISPSEYKLSDKATTPAQIYAGVAKSAEAFRKWKEVAKKLGIGVTDAQIKTWQKDWQGQAPGKTLHRLYKGGEAGDQYKPYSLPTLYVKE